MRSLLFWVMVFMLMAAVMAVTPWYCDDLTYILFGQGMSWKGAIARHWEWLNGRLPNLLLAIAVRHLPHWLVAVVNAAVTVGWLWLLVKLSRASGWGIALVCVVILGFTWWDNFLMLAVSTNYVWASAASLLFLFLLFHCETADRCLTRSSLLILPVLSLLASLMHESLTLSLLLGLLAWLPLSRRPLRYLLLVILPFLAGAVVTLGSPAVWSRASDPGAPDASWLVILVSSCWAVVVLASLLLYLAVTDRPRLLSLLRSPILILVVASFVGCGIALYGGVIGRAGWFAQTFALIVVARVMIPRRPCPPIINYVVALLVVVHLGAVVIEQERLSRDIREVTRLFQQSPDGVVHSDVPLRASSPWWTLGKNVPLPMPNQVYQTYAFSRYYSGGDAATMRYLVVVPLTPAEGYELLPRGFANPAEPLQPHRSRVAPLVWKGHLSVSIPLPDGTTLIAPWFQDFTLPTPPGF